MSARARRLAASMMLPLLVSTGCASPEPAAVVPADLVRPPCRPAPDLMAAPLPLPSIKAGDLMAEVSARDTAAYNALRRAMIDLQKHVRERCQ